MEQINNLLLTTPSIAIVLLEFVIVMWIGSVIWRLIRRKKKKDNVNKGENIDKI